MGVLGAYSDSEIQGRLRRLADELDRLANSDAVPRPTPSNAGHRLRSSLLRKTIEQVLKDFPGPMRSRDIHAAVEDRLNRPVPPSSIKCWLAKNARGHNARLVRLARGRYCLRVDCIAGASS
jgi:hypothetical protein